MRGITLLTPLVFFKESTKLLDIGTNRLPTNMSLKNKKLLTVSYTKLEFKTHSSVKTKIPNILTIFK